MFGSVVEGEMDKAGRNAKGEKQTINARRRVLDKYLHIEANKAAPPPGRYADPAKGKVVRL
jgi:hypothetical protein